MRWWYIDNESFLFDNLREKRDLVDWWRFLCRFGWGKLAFFIFCYFHLTHKLVLLNLSLHRDCSWRWLFAWVTRRDISTPSHFMWWKTNFWLRVCGLGCGSIFVYVDFMRIVVRNLSAHKWYYMIIRIHDQNSNSRFEIRYPLYSALSFSILTLLFLLGTMLYESFLSCSKISFVDSEIWIYPMIPNSSNLLAIITSGPYMSYLTTSVPMIPPMMVPVWMPILMSSSWKFSFSLIFWMASTIAMPIFTTFLASSR